MFINNQHRIVNMHTRGYSVKEELDLERLGQEQSARGQFHVLARIVLHEDSVRRFGFAGPLSLRESIIIMILDVLEKAILF